MYSGKNIIESFKTQLFGSTKISFVDNSVHGNAMFRSLAQFEDVLSLATVVTDPNIPVVMEGVR